jgi:resuscitation-promoting factor RpfB
VFSRPCDHPLPGCPDLRSDVSKHAIADDLESTVSWVQLRAQAHRAGLLIPPRDGADSCSDGTGSSRHAADEGVLVELSWVELRARAERDGLLLAPSRRRRYADAEPVDPDLEAAVEAALADAVAIENRLADPAVADADTETLPALRDLGPIDDLPPTLRLRSGGRQRRRPLLVVGAAALVLLGIGTTVWATSGTGTPAAKDVTIVVDGQASQVRTSAGTVGEALTAAGIAENARDAVSPALSSAISEGSTVTVDRARPLTLTWNGRSQQVWTTADTVGEALHDLNLDVAGRTVTVSADRDAPIPVDGMSLSGTSTLPVTVGVGGAPAVARSATGATVGDVLAEVGIVLGQHDTVSPAATTPVTAGLQIAVTRTSVSDATVRESVPQPTATRVQDPNLDQGTTAVRTAGIDGVESVTYRVTVVNGRQTAKVETGRSLLTAPRAAVIRVGTRVPDPSSEAAAAVAEKKFTYRGEEVFTHDTTFGVNWDGLAYCESTHNPKAVNANPSAGLPTYGMFQFDIPTWESVGGSGNPMDASPSEQLMRAKKLWQSRGLEPWACAYAAHADPPDA